MNTGVWVWPADPKAQRRALRKFSQNPHLMTALTAIAKSKEGLSNAELDEAMADNSEWMTLWAVRQLTSLGFVDFKVDFFGGPAKYQLNELGRRSLATMTGQPPPAPPKPPTPAPAPIPAAQAAKPA
jgi:hypothetical protein